MLHTPGLVPTRKAALHSVVETWRNSRKSRDVVRLAGNFEWFLNESR